MFRLPINSRKIQDSKKVNKVWLCQEFKINCGRISGLANFKIISRKPLIKMPRKKLSCSKKQDGKVSEKKMKLTQEGSKKKLLENNAD